MPETYIRYVCERDSRGSDKRCADIAAELDARCTPADKARIWGGPIVLDASFVAARAEWFARNHPDAWRRARWIMSPMDYIAAKLTGRGAGSYPDVETGAELTVRTRRTLEPATDLTPLYAVYADLHRVLRDAHHHLRDQKIPGTGTRRIEINRSG